MYLGSAVTMAWYEEALTLLVKDEGGVARRPSWLALHGHRAHVLVPCNEHGPLGVIRRWTESAAAEHEIRMLQELSSLESESVGVTVPRHLGKLTQGSATITVQSWLKGKPMMVAGSLHNLSRIRQDLSAFRWWISDRLSALPLASALPNYLSETLARRIHRLLPGTLLQERISQFILSSTPDSQSEFGVMHNDLHPGNLLLGKNGRISGVLDWEHAGPGPLLCDWMTFVNEYVLALRSRENARGGSRVQSNMHSAWFARGPLSQVVRDETRLLLEASRTKSSGRVTCWRLAAFRFAYSRLPSHSPSDQEEAASWLVAAPPTFILD